MDSILEVYNQIIQFGTSLYGLYGQCPGYGYFSGSGPGGYMWHPGHFMMIPLLILLIAMVYLIARNARHKHEAHADLDTPLEIIKKRYAKGEITKEQYENLKTDLKT
jgi:putative membrane protein